MDLEQVTAEVRRNWNALQSADYNPIPVALELLQRSNPAHDVDQFGQLHAALEAEMQRIVDTHYGAFNASIGTFGAIVDRVNATRKLIGSLREQVVGLREQLEFKRTDLQASWTSLQEVRAKTAQLKTARVREFNVRRILDSLDRLTIVVDDASAMSEEPDELRQAFRLACELGLLEERTVVESLRARMHADVAGCVEDGRVEMLKKLALFGNDAKVDFGSLDLTVPVQTVIQRISQQLPLQREEGAAANAVWLFPEHGIVADDFAVYGESVKALFTQLAEVFSGLLKAVEMCPSLNAQLAGAVANELANVVESMSGSPEDSPMQQGARLLKVPHPTVAIHEILKGPPSRKHHDQQDDDFFLNPANVGPAYVFEHPTLTGGVEEVLAASPFIRDVQFPYREIANPRPIQLVDLPWRTGSAQWILYAIRPLAPLLASTQLLERLRHFVQRAYVPKLEAHVLGTVVGQHVSLFSLLGKADVFAVVLRALAMLAYVKHLSDGLVAVEPLMVRVLDAFLTQLETRIRQLTVSKNGNRSGDAKSPRDEAAGIVAMSLVLAQSATLRSLYQAHPVLKCAFSSGREDGAQAGTALTEKDVLIAAGLSEQETIHMAKAKRDRSLHIRELLASVQDVAQVTKMQRRLQDLIRTLKGEGTVDVCAPIELVGDEEDGANVEIALTSLSPIPFVSFEEPSFCGKFWALLKVADGWSRTLLFVLRLEIRLRCFYHTELAFREGLTATADPYIERLCSQLLQLRSALRPVLAYPTFLFVFDGVEGHIERLLIDGLGVVRTFDRVITPGYLRAVVAMLQRCLALLALPTASAQVGDKAALYFELSSLSINDLIAYLSLHQRRQPFSRAECETLIRLHYLPPPAHTALARHPSEAAEADAARAKELQNQLVRLKYLFD